MIARIIAIVQDFDRTDDERNMAIKLKLQT